MLPCFKYNYNYNYNYPFLRTGCRDLFYQGQREKKRIPSNITDLLTEVGLAYWRKDDGRLGSGGALNLHIVILSTRYNY
jgi:hypothetical protein